MAEIILQGKMGAGMDLIHTDSDARFNFLMSYIFLTSDLNSIAIMKI
jgi:hypothetical protein